MICQKCLSYVNFCLKFLFLSTCSFQSNRLILVCCFPFLALDTIIIESFPQLTVSRKCSCLFYLSGTTTDLNQGECDTICEDSSDILVGFLVFFHFEGNSIYSIESEFVGFGRSTQLWVLANQGFEPLVGSSERDSNLS